MREIRAANESELAVLCDKLELVPTRNLNGVVLLVDGDPKVIVGYDGWTDGSVQMHILIIDKQAMGRDILKAAFHYPFVQCKKAVVIGVVRSDNYEALSFDYRLGFITSAIIPDAHGPGVDMHILHLPRHLSKW